MPTTVNPETGSLSAPASPELSIVVPTLRRPDLLDRLLVSLLEQTTGLARFEVIVVDNCPGAPHPATSTLCRDERFQGLALRALHQPVPGASAARNLGIAQARAGLIGFIDDDEALPPDWAARVLAIHAEHRPEIFGGACRPYYSAAKPAWFRDEYMTLSWGPAARWLNPGEYLFGGNLVIRRDWLERTGGYATTVGRIGLNLEYGEETELQQRAVAQGARLWYDPELVIYHYTPPERMRVGWFLNSAWYHGKAKARLAQAKRAAPPRPVARIALAGLRDLLPKTARTAGHLVRGLARNRRTYPRIENYWVERLAPQVSGLSTSVFTTQLLLQSAAHANPLEEAPHA